MTSVLNLSRGTSERAPPYDPETTVKGWRFEVDHERLDRSSTWALANKETRAWLLLMWMTAWRMKPAGSLPNDDELIAAHVGMTPDFFAAHKRVLMRGWWLASDGNLYHDVIADQVARMLGVKTKERDRKNAYREKLKNQGLNPDVPRDSLGKNDTGTGTGTGIKIKAKEKGAPRPKRTPADNSDRAASIAMLAADGIDPEAAEAWLGVRKAKRAGPLTPRAWSLVKSEVAKAGAGWSIPEAVDECVLRGWQSFKAEFVAPRPMANSSGHSPRAITEAELKRRCEALGIGGPRPGESVDQVHARIADASNRRH